MELTISLKPWEIEETFVNQRTAKGWANATEERSLYDLCMSFKSKGRLPLITIEPRSGGDVLQKVSTGNCDTELGIIAATLGVEKLRENTLRLTGMLSVTYGAICRGRNSLSAGAQLVTQIAWRITRVIPSWIMLVVASIGPGAWLICIILQMAPSGTSSPRSMQHLPDSANQS